MIRIAVIVLCAGAGFLAGLFARRERAVPPPVPVPSSPVTRDVNQEYAGLLQKAEARERRIFELQSQPVSGPKPPDKKALAKRLLSLHERTEDLNDPEKKEWIRLRQTIDREMAGVFIDGYRAKVKAGVTSFNELPVVYVWEAGGPEAVDFLIERAEDPKAVSYERNVILTMLSGLQHGYHERESFTATPGAASRARAWAGSQDMLDRSAAAGIYGAMDKREAEPALQKMLEDEHLLVRAAAVKALGNVGDDATLDRLMEFQKSQVQLGGAYANELRRALQEAIQHLYQQKAGREQK